MPFHYLLASCTFVSQTLTIQTLFMKKMIIILLVISFLRQTDLLAQTPMITCPANKTVTITGNSCEAVVTGIDPVLSPAGAEYSFYISSTGQSGFGSASGKTFPLGTSNVIYTLYNDPSVTCSFIVTVEDKTPPVITCPANLTVKCWQDIPPFQDATAQDVCGTSLQVELLSEKRTNEVCENRFIMTRTFKATDASGNSSTCAQVITVFDDEAPTFNFPPPATVTVSCPFQVPPVPTMTGRDNCSSPLDLEDLEATFKQVKTDGSCDNRYTLTRTWTLTDACGNTATCSQIINVDDKTGPVFTRPPASLIEVDCASQIPTDTYQYAEDNCYDLSKLPTVVLTEVITDQQCANKFTLTRTWTATDECGNTSTVKQVIKVNDTRPPVFDGSPPLSNIIVACTKEIPAAPTQTAYDNCGTPTITYSESKSNVQCVNRYTLTRNWVATDGCGNTASRTQVINVDDNEPPKVTAISADPVVLWPPNHKMRDVTINYTATDNCEVTSTLSVTSSDPVNGGSDGDQSPDWEIIDGHHVKLRAEKANNGQARYYTIKITITDGCNEPFDTSVTVVVAHNITSPQTGTSYKIGSNVSFNGVFWDKPGNKHAAKWLLDGSSVTNGSVTEPSGNQNGKVTGNYKFNAAGVYKLQMNVTDQSGSTSYANTNNDLDAIVVVYDPNGGYAYGGGFYNSPVGALKSKPSAEGKASYGFTVNYFKNSANPKGETQFEFKVGDFEFNALNFDYLVINNAMSQFKGTGKIIGGQSGIGFTMTVVDGQLDGSGIDKIRMKIYNKNTGAIIYDNQPGASDATLPTQAVGTNSIIVISGTNSSLTRANTTQKTALEANNPEVSDGLDVMVFPNPSASNFTIIVKGNGKAGKLTMQIVDMYGRIIESINVNVNSPIMFGNRYKSGTYFVRLIQGKEQKEIKLVKLLD